MADDRREPGIGEGSPSPLTSPAALHALRNAVGRCQLTFGTSTDAFGSFLLNHQAQSTTTEHLAAIAWVVDPGQRRMLLVRHRTHGWSCAGGHVEPFEQPVDAAARELREETGIRLGPPAADPLTIALTQGCARHIGESVRHWTLGYLFETKSSVEPIGEVGQPAKWFAFERLPSRRPPDVDRVVAVLDRRFR